MTLVGTRVGSCDVIALLGVGGMGEVYRAHDTRLGRDVAIKILPASLARDPDRLSRFEREARVLASLNHPHIGAIYGVEETGGTRALVLELVEGDMLAERLAARSARSGAGLPLDEALEISRQIADALDAAHERGIVHRDLKPANIKITPGGVVKVLDFGLAKGMDPKEGEGSDSPTMIGSTAGGMLLGTAPYMSPEQARGTPVDRRADIWAFGCLLYELLTGAPPFRGETTSDVLARILEREPDWSALPASTPPHIVRVVQRCLQKDLKRRLRDIGDARADLDAPPLAATSKPARSWRPVVLAGAGLAAGAALTALSLTAFRPQPAAVREVQVHRLTDSVGMESSPAISPDGKAVAFVEMVNGRRQIRARLLSGGTPLNVTTDDADHDHPRFAPDSSTVIYYSPAAKAGVEGAIWEISLFGGEPRRITAAISGGDISHDGRRLAAFQMRDGKAALVVMTRDGAGPTSIGQVPAGSTNSLPRWSPDDRWIAFQTFVTTEFDTRVQVIPSQGGQLRSIARSADLKGLCWLPDGSTVVYSSSLGSTVLYPPTFNLRAVHVDGSGDRQLTFGQVSYVAPDASASGGLVASSVRSQSDVWKFPVGGSPLDNTRDAVRITTQTGLAQTPSVSPDGTELVYLSDSGGHGNLWVARTDRSGVRQITYEKEPATSVGVPIWAPSGNQILFLLTRDGTAALWLVNSDGSGLRRLVNGVWAYWSADARWIYFTTSRNGTNCIDKLAVAEGPPVQVRCDNAMAPGLSPDGSTLYYVTPLIGGAGGLDLEVRRASPENGPSTVMSRLSGLTIPEQPFNVHLIVSPDGRWLVTPLTDGVTTNLWVLPADGGPLRQLTDFGRRSVTIVRRTSWSRDGKYLFAAVAEIDADVVLLDGLVPAR